MTPWYVDSDLALGSSRGDVDDAFALAALLLGQAPVVALGAVFGNTSAVRAEANLEALARVCGWEGEVLAGAAKAAERGSGASRYLLGRREPCRALALGPLTNLAAALDAGAGCLEEIVLVGGRLHTAGRWPPLWPFEFNLTLDRWATQVVFASGVPLTVLPLDVAGQCRMSWPQVAALPGPAGGYLAAGARRWFRRARWLKARRTVPMWDLPAAWYALEPGALRVRETTAELSPRGLLSVDRGKRPVRVIEGFTAVKVWKGLVDALGC